MSASLPAAEWTWTWQASTAEKDAQVVICPMQYDKKWGYAIEIDDQPQITGTFAPDFFAQFQYSEAPPGVSGGKLHPVVGSMAIFPACVGANSTYLSFDDLRAIQKKGWGVVNHSYFHRGRSYGDPPETLTPEQMKEDLFWSQTIIAHENENGRAPSHFVAPNGYRAWEPLLGSFGLVSVSAVGGSGGRNLESPKANLLNLSRAHLDENKWTGQWGKSDPMLDFPAEGPISGDLIIDFTHGMNPDPASDNQRRWKTRLETVTSKYGVIGSDEMWSAPTEQIVNYTRAAKAAQVKLSPGKVAVTLPDNLPGSAITLRITGMPEAVQIPVPEGGCVYRKGTTVWITSPMIGLPGAPAPQPLVKRVYQGDAAAEIQLKKPARIACVQIRQHGAPITPLKVDLVLPDGSTKSLGEEMQTRPFISKTTLFSTIPNSEPIKADKVRITAGANLKSLKGIEVWAVEEP